MFCTFINNNDNDKFIETHNIQNYGRLQYTPSRQLRSSDHQLLSQPTDSTVFAGRAFSSTAPRIWNSLPITIRTASTTTTFRRHLKTHLFSGNTAID